MFNRRTFFRKLAGVALGAAAMAYAPGVLLREEPCTYRTSFSWEHGLRVADWRTLIREHNVELPIR